MRIDRTWCVWAAAALSAGGCGGTGPVPVRGAAAVRGVPLPYGQVVFQPVDPRAGRPALAKIGRDGHFEAASFAPGDGLMPGEYRIAIDPHKPEFDLSAKDLKAPAIDRRYTDGATSGLTITVKPGDRPHWLDLSLDPG